MRLRRAARADRAPRRTRRRGLPDRRRLPGSSRTRLRESAAAARHAIWPRAAAPGAAGPDRHPPARRAGPPGCTGSGRPGAREETLDGRQRQPRRGANSAADRARGHGGRVRPPSDAGKMSRVVSFRPAFAASDTMRMLRIESPPSAKRLSWMPGDGMPSASPQMRLAASRWACAASRCAAGESRAVQRGGSVDLAVAAQRQRVEHHVDAGHHVVRQRRGQRGGDRGVAQRRAVAERDIRAAAAAGLVAIVERGRLADFRNGGQRVVDLPETDAVAADLQLVVAAVEHDRSIGQVAADVAGAVQANPARGWNGSSTNASRVAASLFR